MTEKTGILTFQNTLNYGAHLQAYGLCTALRNLGIKSEIIDYDCREISGQYSLKFGENNASLKGVIKWLLSVRFLQKKKAGFSGYLKEYLSMENYDRENVEKADNVYKTIIVGSDQVWNFKLTGDDKTYLLNFAKNARKVAYAASIGRTELTNHERKQLKKYLDRFEAVSVREKEGVLILNELHIANRGQMIDPTFLIDKAEWERQFKIRKKYEKSDEYILIYAQGRPEHGIAFAKKLAERERCRIKIIHQYARRYSGMENIRDASVEEFLYLIANAKHVVTTSFHGMALSLILHTSVFFEMKHDVKSTNSRIISLAELFRIEKREIVSEDVMENVNEIDFEETDRIIKREQKKAVGFLGEICGERGDGEA